MTTSREFRRFYAVGSVVLLIFGLLCPIISHASKCETCKDITRRFKEGIDRTSNSNFGGGNTRWEETNLGSFTFSETRLIEILEHCCQDGTKECHHMLEENEELLERWWFLSYAKGNGDEDLQKFLCESTLKVCCPEGTYGPDCVDCPSGKESPCSGHGRCQGSGTRNGDGTCACDPGYQGDVCNECNTKLYFEESKNETHTSCAACHFACLKTCHGPGSSSCDDCISGWSFEEGQGCIECDAACDGCSGTGPNHCINCSTKHFHDGTICRACHRSCDTSCTDETAKSCDSCASGWSRTDDGDCQDVDECQAGLSNCKSADTFCQNTEGSFFCQRCHQACNGCVGPSNKDCNDCQSGYSENEEGECQDVDECHSAEDVCSSVGERCVNSLGSYSCECVDGYFKRNGKCNVKRKDVKKKKKRKESSSTSSSSFGERKLSEITPESLAEEIKKLGQPIRGVPLENDDNAEEMITMGGNFETPKDKGSTDDREMQDDTDRTEDVRDDL